MPNLNEILADAQGGDAVNAIGREFGLTPRQTEAAVAALLPAISMGLKQSTATPEGLGNLFSVMGRQPELQAMYDDPVTALSGQGRAAGNEVLSTMFGSPDASRAIVDQAQRFSGVSSGILKKLLPVLAGILISGLMKGGSGQAAPSAPSPSSGQGGGLGDILGQIFGRGAPGSPGSAPTPAPSSPAPPTSPGQDGGLGDILGQIFGREAPGSAGSPPSSGQAAPAPTGAPGGDLLGQILREFEKGIREGRIKPVIIGGGPVQIPMPGQPGPTPGGQAQPQFPGGDIFGQILRDLLGGAAGGQPRQGPPVDMKDLSDKSKGLGLMDGVGAAVFGDRLDAGQDVAQNQLDSFQQVLDRFLGTQRR
jgi:hypothetical protein